MNKQVFLEKLRQGLSALPREEQEERVSFYSEMIDDRIEDGLSEEQAVASVGDLDRILLHSFSDAPPTEGTKAKPKKQEKPLWLIILLILGFPIWFSVGISLFAAVFSLLVSLWALFLSLCITSASLLFAALAAIASSVMSITVGSGIKALVDLGTGLICAGLGIFFCILCIRLAKGLGRLTKKCFQLIGRIFRKKEDLQ